jgi:Transposase IS66 family
LQQAQQWLQDSKDLIPTDVKFCLTMLIENMLKGEKSSQNAAKGFHELLVKFGFKPSSEKLKKSAVQKDIPSLEVVQKLGKSAKQKVGHFRSAKAKLNKHMQNQLSLECLERDAAEIKKLELIDDINDEEQRDAAQDADLNARLALGQGEGIDLDSQVETLFPAGPVILTEQKIHFEISKDALIAAFGGSPKGLTKETISTTRQDFSLQLREFQVSYETAKDPQTGRSLTSAPASIGPKGFQITYRAMVNLTLLTVGFLVPMHRVSRLLGNTSLFHRSNIARYLGFAAGKMLPVYLELAKQLSNAAYLWGDATPTRVNEVNRAIDSRKEWIKADLCGPPEPTPWEKSFEPTTEDLEELTPQKRPIWKQLQSELGYAFIKKTKKSFDQKTRHQTMVVHGKGDEKDSFSHIVFYRSCLGDVGNVLDYLLQFRNTKNKNLVLQCDHSSANLPSNPDVLKRINLTVAGCFAHARRLFKKHESQDPLVGEDILPMMFMVMQFETRLKEAGKNEKNTISVRQSWSAQYLETIYFALKLALQKPNWSDQTPLGKAARHFIKHFKKLTVYLAHPQLEATNNSSERALRPEKLSQGSSYFRDTMEGRARFDILRTIYQTCTCAGIPFAHYLLYVLMTPNTEMETQPQDFTPLAVKKLLESKPDLKSKLDTILARGY